MPWASWAARQSAARDWQRADWTISQAARALVLTSGSERQHTLRRVGGELAGRWAELAGAETSPLAGLVPNLTEGDPREIARLQARRWATELDIDHYRTEQDDRQRTTMIIDYPGDVVAGLAEAGGRSAHAAVDITSLMYRAVQCRDGKNGHDPVQLHSELTRAREELAAAGPQAGGRHKTEAVAAVAATLILGPSRGTDIPDDCLTWAARELLGIAQHHADTPLPRYGTPNQSWYQGADRSAATALPLLLADPALPLRAGTDIAAVSAAVIALGGSFYTEVRERLSAGLRQILEPCEDADPAAQHAAVNALREMTATSGLGPGDGGSRQHSASPNRSRTLSPATNSAWTLSSPPPRFPAWPLPQAAKDIQPQQSFSRQLSPTIWPGGRQNTPGATTPIPMTGDGNWTRSPPGTPSMATRHCCTGTSPRSVLSPKTCAAS